jgi:hypothetical protein
MKKRGKIVRNPCTGPGLLMIEGRQYLFCLEDVWKSEVSPAPGLTVEVELDWDGKIVVMSPVSESQPTHEQAQQSVDASRRTGLKILRTIAARCGLPNPWRR